MTVREYLENCTDCEIVSFWNKFCDVEQYNDDMCYNMFDFEEIVDPDSIPFREMYEHLDDEFNFNDDVFWWDGLGNIHSGMYYDFINAVVDLDSLADSIEENPNDYGIDLEDICY